MNQSYFSNLNPKYNLVDKITIAYNLFILTYVIIFFENIHSGYRLILWHSLYISLILWLIPKLDQMSSKIIQFIRTWYAPFCYLFLYEEISLVNTLVFPNYLDAYFQRVDFWVFGWQPSLEWASQPFWSRAWIRELFYFSYFTYYFLIPFLGFYLYFKKPKYQVWNFLFGVSLTFYICYAIYCFLPVIGARVWGTTFSEPGYFFQNIMEVIYAKGEIDGAAFPSSHVAIALVVCLYGLKYWKKGGYFLTVDFLLLSLSTIYCRFHYVVDVFAGILVGIVVYRWANKIFFIKQTPENTLVN